MDEKHLEFIHRKVVYFIKIILNYMFLLWSGKNPYSLVQNFSLIYCTIHIFTIYSSLYRIVLMKKKLIPWKTTKGTQEQFFVEKDERFWDDGIMKLLERWHKLADTIMNMLLNQINLEKFLNSLLLLNQTKVCGYSILPHRRGSTKIKYTIIRNKYITFYQYQLTLLNISRWTKASFNTIRVFTLFYPLLFIKRHTSLRTNRATTLVGKQILTHVSWKKKQN